MNSSSLTAGRRRRKLSGMADWQWSRLRAALGAEGLSRGRRALVALAALAIAAAGWLPCLHFFYAPRLGTEKVSDTFSA